MQKIIALVFAGLFLTLAVSAAQDAATFKKPQTGDKCPVCGMFVAKYPDWIAAVRLVDGSYAFFDGCKDLFKYYFAMATYAPGKVQADISSVIVTDYYSVQPVDGRTAFFVLGSDVFGPMGKELIPFGRENDAREFLKDHQGKRILSFEEITPAIIEELDR